MLILLFLLYGAGFVALQFVCEFAPKPAPLVSSYNGLVVDPCKSLQQQGDASCGHASLAYLLSLYNIPCTENEITKTLKKTEWLTFKDMADYLEIKKLKWQALEFPVKYFIKHPSPGIMHVSWGHFIVFIDFVNRKDALLFDPAQGLVLVSKKTLAKIWDGYFFYVYN